MKSIYLFLRHTIVVVFIVSFIQSVCLSQEDLICNCDTKSYIAVVAKETISHYLLQRNYEQVLNILNNEICLQLSNDGSLSFNDVMAAVYICLLLGNSDQAEDYMNYLCNEYNNSIRGLYYLKGIIECYNDNYGNAERSFTQEILNSLSFSTKIDDIEHDHITNDLVNEQVISFLLLCKAIQSKAYVLAVRGKRDEVFNELERLNRWREIVQGFYFATNAFSKEVPLSQFTDISPNEYILNKYVSSDVALFYRIREQNSSLLEQSLNENSKTVLTIPEVSWWCNIIDSSSEKELFNIFLENANPSSAVTSISFLFFRGGRFKILTTLDTKIIF